MRTYLFFICLVWLRCFAFGQETAALHHLVEEERKNFHIPNSVVIWVKEGQVLFKNISWDSTLAGNSPIIAHESLFRVGSISKPFTGMAALRLEEEGLLHLDADLNRYFDAPFLRYAFNTPITARHLLTHTAGFDDFYINKSARTKEEVISLAHTVQSLMPEQVMPPGEIYSYSNYGVALLGHLMERASQKDFSSIVEERVFQPMNMHRSTFEPKASDYQQLVKAWANVSGKLEIVPYDYIKDAPAGQMLTTADDMARFMQLITAPADSSTQAMKALFERSILPQFSHHDSLQGKVAALWSIGSYAGHLTVSHNGGYVGVAARFFYFPEHRQALFIFANLMDFQFVSQVTDKLMAAFLPAAAEETVPTARIIAPFEANDAFSLDDFAGYYRNTRYSRHSMLKMAALFGAFGVGGEMRLQHDSNYLTMPDHTGQTRRLLRTDTLLFSSIDDDYHLAFRQENGKITHVFTSGTSALERVHFWETSFFQLGFLATSWLIFSAVFVWGLIGLLKRAFTKSFAGHSPSFLLAWAISAAYVGQVLLLFLGGLSVPAYELEIGFGYGVPILFYVANALPFVAILLTGGMLYLIIQQKGYGKAWIARAGFSMLSFCYLACLYYWNLVGWHF